MIDDTLDAFQGSKWFSTLDLACGYWQVALDPQDAEKSAFYTNDGGLWQLNVLTFGLATAQQTFETSERLMECYLPSN